MGRGPRTPPMLEVRQMFEPTRLAAACLEAAYARIVPMPWRRTRSATALPSVGGVPITDRRGVMPPTREVRHG
jgi:hypothetical protein